VHYTYLISVEGASDHVIVATSRLNKLLQNIAIEARKILMLSQIPNHKPILELIRVGMGNDTYAVKKTILDLICIKSIFSQ